MFSGLEKSRTYTKSASRSWSRGFRGFPSITVGAIGHCFAGVKQWPIAPTVIDGNPRKPLLQLLEADLVYVRDFSSPENMTGEQWKHLAMIAHHCYGSIDLVMHAIISA